MSANQDTKSFKNPSILNPPSRITSSTFPGGVSIGIEGSLITSSHGISSHAAKRGTLNHASMPSIIIAMMVNMFRMNK